MQAELTLPGFYTRKVKYTQETFCEKIAAILEGFPRLQDIHPFRERRHSKEGEPGADAV